MRTLLIVFLIVIAGLSTVHAQDCRGTGSGSCCHPTQYGKCFKVHGRYAIYVENNGIWMIGTRRLLSTAGDEKLDKLIEAQGDWQEYALIGDYVVCPASMYRPKQMQSVCVQSYTHLRVVKRP